MTLYRFLRRSSLIGTLTIGSTCVVSTAIAQLHDPPDLILRVAGDTGSASGDGTSWDAEDAFLYLQDAIDAAEAHLDGAPGDYVDIWVKGGDDGSVVYYPDEGDTQSNNDQVSTFVLSNHVQLLGGFGGNESNRDLRSPLANITILSGDLQQNDPTSTDNAYRVVNVGQFDGNDAVIDGFWVVSGKSTGNGAGMVIGHATGGPSVLRCTFFNNHALLGGGLYAKDGEYTIANCRFMYNSADAGGGYFQENGADVTLLNCLFDHNEATGSLLRDGGAIYNLADDLTIVNCTIADNIADDATGGVYNASVITVVNSILWGNTDGAGGTTTAQAQVNGGTATVTYNCIQGGGTSNNNINTDPDFITGYDLDTGSDCIDAGDTSTIQNAAYEDVFDLNNNADDTEATPDLDLDCRVAGEDVDMGAYEFQTESRPPCPADLFPVVGGDASVGPGDLGELLSNWGACGAPCPSDIFPVGAPSGTVGAGDLGELLANWGMCPRVDCGAEELGGGGEGGFGEQDWPEVELTEELYDWLTSTSLEDIFDWLCSLLEE